MRRRHSTPLQSLARFINRLRFPSLYDYDTEELVAELEARGWSVTGP